MAKRVKVGGYIWKDEVERLIRMVRDEVQAVERIHHQAKREENKNELARLLASHAEMLGILYDLLRYDGSSAGDVLAQVEEMMEEDA